MNRRRKETMNQKEYKILEEVPIGTRIIYVMVVGGRASKIHIDR